MVAVRGALVALLLALLPAAGARAQAGLDGELSTWLEERLVDPLDLREATVEELGRLPWLDLHLARAVVGLREHGGLGGLEDLLQVPGLGREELEAIRPFVFLPPAARDASPGWARATTGWAATGQRDPAGIGALDLEHGSLRLALRQRRGGAPAGWLRWGARGGVRVWAGDLAPVAPAPLAWGDGRPSSRTGRVSPGSAASPRGRLRAPDEGGWRGLAGLVPLGPLELGGGGSAHGEGPRGWLQARARVAGREAGVAAAADGRAGAWLADEGSRLDLGWGGGALRASGRWRQRLEGWTTGLAATTAPAGGGGDDPVTGQRLDRPHHAWQLDLAVARPGWRGELLCRRVWRARRDEPRAAGTQRVELRLRAPALPGEARVRIDEGLEGSAPPELASRWALGPFAVGGGEWRVALRRGSAAGPAAELWSATLDRPGGPGSWQLRAALARGPASQPWGIGAGGVGPLVRWLRPGEGGLAGRWRVEGRGFELLLWSGLQGGAELPLRAWGGVSLRWRGRWCEGC